MIKGGGGSTRFNKKNMENQHSRYGAIARALPPTCGKVFFVCHDDNTAFSELEYEFPVDSDGVPRVYRTIASAATDQLAIQAALDACVSGRGDYVIVLPGDGNDYDLGAVLTMEKNDVHLISLEGLDRDSNRVGAGRQVVLEQTYAASDVVYITGQNCEFAGFYVKNKANYSAVQTGATAHCAYIHHNLFYMITSTTMALPVVDLLTTHGAIYCTVSNNFFTSHAGTCLSAIGTGAASTGAMVTGNYIVVGDGATLTTGIHADAYKGVVERNTVVAVTGAGADGTVTTAYNTNCACNRNIANTANTADFTDDGTYMAAGNYCGDINHLS